MAEFTVHWSVQLQKCSKAFCNSASIVSASGKAFLGGPAPPADSSAGVKWQEQCSGVKHSEEVDNRWADQAWCWHVLNHLPRSDPLIQINLDFCQLYCWGRFELTNCSCWDLPKCRLIPYFSCLLQQLKFPAGCSERCAAAAASA